MSDLEDLLASYLERREAGEPVSPEGFAAEHPEHGETLLSSLRNLERTERLMPAAPAGLPDRVGPYEVLGEIGAGGSGRVLLVHRPDRPGVELALKLLHPGAMLHPNVLARFRREAEALRRLRDPHIVEVVDVGEHEGCPFLVMPRIDGQPLSAWRPAAGDDPHVTAASLVGKVARAVQGAHDQGVLHRDLKPANVLVRPGGEPVVVDFGLAAAESDETLTRTGDVLGTPAFMAPEQARGQHADSRTDVYGLGAILYHLLSGRPPHTGGDSGSVLEKVRRQPPPPVARVATGVPRTLESIVRRATAFRPARRFATAGELASALEDFAAGRPVATGYGLGARAEDFVRLHRRSLLSAAAAVLLVGIVAVVWDQRQVRVQAEVRRTETALAQAYLAGETETAEGLAQRLAGLDADKLLARHVLGMPPGESRFLAALAAGEHAYNEGDFAEAVLRLGEAAAAEPGSPVAVARYGMAARRAGELETAERELTAASRMLAGSAVVLEELLEACKKRKRWPEARAAVERLLDLNDTDPRLWHELARVCAYGGEPEEALSAVERACALAQDEVPLTFLRTKGAILDALGRDSEGIELLHLVAERAPSAQQFLNLAIGLDGAHRLAEAREAYLAALDYRPGDLQALVSLAYLHAGSDRENCGDCRRAFAEHPELLDPSRVEEYALRALEAERGKFVFAEVVAEYAARGGKVTRLRAALEDLLEQDFPAEALGRLVRASRILQDR